MLGGTVPEIFRMQLLRCWRLLSSLAQQTL
jgi:hypothetical protein